MSVAIVIVVIVVVICELIIKSGSTKNSLKSYTPCENEIYRVDISFNKDSKNIILGEERPETWGKWPKQEIYCNANYRVVKSNTDKGLYVSTP